MRDNLRHPTVHRVLICKFYEKKFEKLSKNVKNINEIDASTSF